MRWVVGLLLVVAAVLKAVQLASEPAATVVTPLGGWLLPIQVGLELGLGVIVLSGLYWQRIRWLALALFVAFAAYSLNLALGGAASCGCFGPIKVHPWWTFMLDVTIVIGILISIRRTQHGARSEGSRRFSDWVTRHQTAATVILSLSVVSTALLVRYADSRTAIADNSLSTAGGLVILEPERWIGQRLPIAEFINVDLSRGRWIVLLHRHDCPDCQNAVPRYEELAAHNLDQRIALVEVPPYGESLDIARGACDRARLRDDREWFVRTPVEIRLQDGTVTGASTELPALLSSAGR